MSSARRLACLGLAVVAAGPGCLAAPPPTEGEVESCRPFVENDFDDISIWTAYTEPGTAVDREPDEVRITATPTTDLFAVYADLHSESMLPVAATELAATLVVTGDGYPVGGISWADDTEEGPEDDDYYDLVIDSGYLHAVRKQPFAERVVLCSPTCPEYDPSRHAHLRLRAAGALVYYQASEDGVDWSDIASAPLSNLTYRSIAFAYADPRATTDLSVTQMAWADCQR